MNRFTPFVLLGVVSLAACADDPVEPPRELQTAFNASIATPATQLVVFEGSSIPADFGARVTALGGRVEQALNPVGVAFVSGLDAASSAALKAQAGIRFMEPDVVLPLVRPTLYEKVMDAAPQSPAQPGTARFHYLQWHHRQIGAPAAWAAGKLGSPDVRVGIIDTGLDYVHPDLVGLVDLARSRSFLPSEDSVVAKYLGAHPVYDLQGHGTHVGSTVSSNATITAGVTSKVQLVGLKVCRSEIPGLTGAGCPASATFAALIYAADNGIDVVNLSLGGLFTRRGSGGYEETVNRVFNYAKAKQLTVVVSAGNSNVDLDRGIVPTEVVSEDGKGTTMVDIQYPSLYATYCSSTHTICVSATGPASATNSQSGPWFDIDSKASYSNYGRDGIDVAAPGGTNAGAVWAACPTYLVAQLSATSWGAFIDGYCRQYPVGMGGTSMAAPHVTALAALLVERHGRNPDKIAEAIRKYSDDLGEPGNDPIYGKGRINVARALGL